MYAGNSHSYTHLILALGIVREPTVWLFITSKYPGTHDIGLPTRVTSKRCGHRQAAIATNCLGERLYQSDKIGLVVIICGITVHAAGLGRKQGYQPTRACPRFGPRRGFICLDSCSLRTKSCVVDLPYSGAQATSRHATSGVHTLLGA